MTVFDTALNTLFLDTNLSVAATYTPSGGSGAAVRVIVEHDVELISIGASDVADRRTVIGVRKSDVVTPGKGDTILVGATTYTVDVIISDDSYETQVSVR